ncbi:MAG: zinc-dependent peptidase [Mycobacteriales bacterium]
MTTHDANLDDVIDPELDKGVPHDRGASGGSPDMPDGLMQHQAELDRRAAGLTGADEGDGTVQLRSRRRGLPDDGREIVERHLAVWQLLDDDERERLLVITDQLLSRKRWEAAQGFTLEDTVRVVIAAQAALLVLNLDADHYRLVSAVVVHPSTLTVTGERAGLFHGSVSDEPLPVLGLAQSGRGPVVVAWDQALAGASGTVPGHNVVLHEFAHKLDMLDGTIDGTPLLPRDVRDDWVRICTEVYDDLISGHPRPPMRWYGATNPGEFFAVATEVFYEQSRELRDAEPDLYGVLARFYRQDPAGRSVSRDRV